MRDTLTYFWHPGLTEEEIKAMSQAEAKGKYSQFLDDWIEDAFIKCECGSEKTYGKDATHSYWCPKFKEFK